VKSDNGLWRGYVHTWIILCEYPCSAVYLWTIIFLYEWPCNGVAENRCHCVGMSYWIMQFCCILGVRQWRPQTMMATQWRQMVTVMATWGQTTTPFNEDVYLTIIALFLCSSLSVVLIAIVLVAYLVAIIVIVRGRHCVLYSLILGV